MLSHAECDVHELALDKVGRILGPERARTLIAGFLAGRRGARLTSPEDLYAFGASVEGQGGMERAVGALLMLQATLLGAGEPD